MERLRNIVRLPHSRNVFINTLGNYIGFAFAGFYIVFLVRVFKPEEFGVLTILMTVSYILANILSFGMPAAIYAHVPELLDDKKKAFNFITSNFLFLTVLSSVSLLLVYTFIGKIDEIFLKTDAPWYLFLYALIGAQMFIWQNFVRDVLNAAGRFLHINIAINLSNAIKVGLLIWLAVKGTLTISSTLIILMIIGPAIVFAIVLFERRYILKAVAKSITSRKHIQFSYTFTFFLATQLFQLATRTDILLVSYFLTRPEVGLYGLSQRIILAVVTSSDAITQVMSPQFAKVKTQEDVIKSLKHSFTYMLIPTVMFIGGIIMPGFVYDLVFGADYTSSTLLTKALSFAYIPYSFLAATLLFFLYTVKKPQYLLYTNAIFFGVIVAGNLLLIPHYRLAGPPITFLTAFVLIGVCIFIMFRKELRALPKK